SSLLATAIKKFISVLDRTRIGHTRFRRGPVTNPPQNQQQQKIITAVSKPIGEGTANHHQAAEEKAKISGCLTPIQRLPPLPHTHPNRQTQ
ncbi:unnamed protein product, partial [Ilex paraguariensis]